MMSFAAAKKLYEDDVAESDSLTITVKAEWDSEADVWVATSEDLPGLIIEASSMDELVPELELLVPQLLQSDNDTRPTHRALQYDVIAHIHRSMTLAYA